MSGDASPSKRPRLADDPLSGLRTPCYIVDLAVARSNAKRMLEKAAALGVELRPHVKTHKTIEGALLQTGGRRSKIVVSTLAEASFFAKGGFDDILYAVPITPDKLDDAAKLTCSLTQFHVLVDHSAQVDALLAKPPSAEKKWSIVVMVDCGYHRDGVDPDDDASMSLVKRIAHSSVASFAGVYTHGGHSYDAKSVEQVHFIGEAERDAVAGFAKRLRDSGVECAMVGVGSTPTASNPPESLAGVTEMHPGNYLFYDWMQVQLKSCRPADVAVRVCSRIIGQYPKQNMLLIDLGWTGISKQGAEFGYGAIDGHPELRIKTLKQEAGEIESADGKPLDFSRYPIGYMIRVMPWHSCAASHQHDSMHVLLDGKITERWEKVRGW